MLKQRWQNALIMVIFLAMLILPLLYADWKGGASSATENRVLAKAPWAMEDQAVNYPDATEAWINDNAGFRSMAMKTRVRLEYGLFRHSTVSNYLIGQEEWIYFAPQEVISDYVGENLWPQGVLDEWNENLKLLNRLVEDSGAKLLMTIVPDKKTMYPEYYSPYLRHETEKTRTNQLAESIRANQSFPLVLMQETLEQNKYRGYLYFLRTDTGHWNKLGAYVGYEKLMQEAEKLIGKMTYVPLDQCTIKPVEEIGTFLNAIDLKEPGYRIENERTSHQEMKPEYLDKHHFLTYENLPNQYKKYYVNTQGERLPRILYVGDSYGLQIDEYLAQSAASMMYIHRSDIKTLHRLLDYEQFDLVIFEMVERMVPAFYSDLAELNKNWKEFSGSF